MICGTPSLKDADRVLGELYSTVWKAALAGPRKTLVAGQLAWLAARDKGCAAVDCLRDRIAARRAVLDALAARVSEPNPTLFDVTAVWLTGSWRIGEVEANGFVPGPLDFRAPGVVTGRPGELCSGPGQCQTFGLEPHKTSEFFEQNRLPSVSGIATSSPFYSSVVNGKAEMGFIAASDGSLVAVAPECDRSMKRCGYATQRWTPKGPDARVATQSAGP